MAPITGRQSAHSYPGRVSLFGYRRSALTGRSTRCRRGDPTEMDLASPLPTGPPVDDRWRRRDGHDDRAVSPVVGVLLMVAITVVLAAVVGSLVVGSGVASGVAPATTSTHVAVATVDADAGSLVIVADSGQTAAFDGRVVAGDSATVGDADPVPPDTVVRVVWVAPDGGTARTLATDRTPA